MSFVIQIVRVRGSVGHDDPRKENLPFRIGERQEPLACLSGVVGGRGPGRFGELDDRRRGVLHVLAQSVRCRAGLGD